VRAQTSVGRDLLVALSRSAGLNPNGSGPAKNLEKLSWLKLKIGNGKLKIKARLVKGVL
jgi:hypothetical protein